MSHNVCVDVQLKKKNAQKLIYHANKHNLLLSFWSNKNMRLFQVNPFKTCQALKQSFSKTVKNFFVQNCSCAML